MPVNVLQHDNRVVNHNANRQDNREQGEQVDAEAHQLHEEQAAHQGQRHRYSRNQHRTQGAEEQENDDNHDDHRLDNRGLDIIDRVLDIDGGIVVDITRDALRQAGCDVVSIDLPHPGDHFDGIGIGGHVDLHEHRLLIDEHGGRGITLIAQLDFCDVPQTHDSAVLLAQHHVFKTLHRTQVGVSLQVHLDHAAFARAHRGEHVIGRQRCTHLAGGQPQRRHALLVQPDAHGKYAGGIGAGAQYARQGRQLGLYLPNHVIRHAVGGQLVADKRDVHAAHLLTDGQVKHRVLRLLRQLVTQLVDLGDDLGEHFVGVGLGADIGGNGAQAAHAGGGEIVDTLRRCDLQFQRRGNETLDQLRIGADIGRAHRDHCILDHRVFAHVELGCGTHAQNQQEQADNGRQYGLVDKKVRELHVSRCPVVGRVPRRAETCCRFSPAYRHPA